MLPTVPEMVWKAPVHGKGPENRPLILPERQAQLPIVQAVGRKRRGPASSRFAPARCAAARCADYTIELGERGSQRECADSGLATGKVGGSD